MRNKTLRILFSLLIVATSFTAGAQKRTPFFVQISDLQLGFITQSEDFAPEQELMQRITAQVNALMPDFIVFSGDMVH